MTVLFRSSPQLSCLLSLILAFCYCISVANMEASLGCILVDLRPFHQTEVKSAGSAEGASERGVPQRVR